MSAGAGPSPKMESPQGGLDAPKPKTLSRVPSTLLALLIVRLFELAFCLPFHAGACVSCHASKRSPASQERVMTYYPCRTHADAKR